MSSLPSFKPLVIAACFAALAGCQTPPASTTGVKYMNVSGAARLPYVEQGSGTPVIFVHGAVSDLRTWNPHREALANSQYRAISYTQRYFGTDPWGARWPAFGVQTHSDDLVALIRGLNAGPVHLVGWSYSGQTVLNVALRHPELVRSAFVFEPAHTTFIVDAADQKALGDDAGLLFAPVAEAVKAGDNSAAARYLIDGVGERKGYFEALPATAKNVILDSARTMPLLINQASPPPITCAQLGEIKRPVALVRGAEVRPFFRVIADAAARCMPRQRYIVIPGQKHMWPGEDIDGFNATLVGFLRTRE